MVEFKGEDEESRCRGKPQRAGDGGIPVRVKGAEDHFRAAFPKETRSASGAEHMEEAGSGSNRE